MGDGVAGEREAPASTSRSQFRAVFKKVSKHCNLPPFPKVASRAIALARNPLVRTEDVARVVAVDAALSARVLKISRSVTYLRLLPPETIHEAIVTVGFEKLRGILIVASARAMYRPHDPTAERLWAHGLATALAADELREAGEKQGGHAFIAGLLHDVGKLVFHMADADAFAGLGHYDEEGEKQVYGASHPVVGALLADMWGIETEVSNAVMEHHARPVGEGLARRLAIADCVAYQIGHGSVPGDEPPPAPDETVDLSGVIERVAQAFDVERALFD